MLTSFPSECLAHRPGACTLVLHNLSRLAVQENIHDFCCRLIPFSYDSYIYARLLLKYTPPAKCTQYGISPSWTTSPAWTYYKTLCTRGCFPTPVSRRCTSSASTPPSHFREIQWSRSCWSDQNRSTTQITNRNTSQGTIRNSSVPGYSRNTLRNTTE